MIGSRPIVSIVQKLLIVAIGLDILQIKKLPIGNLLPAIFVAAGIAIMIG